MLDGVGGGVSRGHGGRAAAGANVANVGRAAASSNLSDEAGGENRANGGRLLARRVSLVSDGDGGSIKIERMNCVWLGWRLSGCWPTPIDVPTEASHCQVRVCCSPSSPSRLSKTQLAIIGVSKPGKRTAAKRRFGAPYRLSLKHQRRPPTRHRLSRHAKTTVQSCS